MHSMLAEVPISEHMLIDHEIFRHIDENRAFKQEIKGFCFPPISLMVDAHSSWNYREYYRGGQKAARIVTDVVLRHKPMTADILEWGCGPGRVIRHLPGANFLGPARRYHGADYNRGSIEWCTQNLPGINFVLNDLVPPLPFAESSFDLSYCRSVFTHLSEDNSLAWMSELKRVTRTRGLICFSTHGDQTLPKLAKDEAARYRAGSYVQRANDSEGLRSFAAFHPPGYVRNRLASGLEIIEHRTDLGNQDVWVARVP
jgi:SAM-dependent methyltransferase